jgi:ABC-type lipoprotein release transport system permease subunit
MAFGLGIFIWMDSIMKGMDRMGLESIIEYTDSSLRITTDAWAEEFRGAPLDYGIEGIIEDMRTFLANQEGVLETSERTRFTGELSNGYDGIPVLAIAVDPGPDERVFSITDNITGRWLSSEAQSETMSDPRELVMGYLLAEKLGFLLGTVLPCLPETALNR